MPKTVVKPKKTLTFPRVDVVEASAGSGKTYALARRYVQLILHPSLKAEDTPLKAVLAVTFTNKATKEMKERILEFLKKIALDAFDNEAEKKDILSSLTVSYPIARKMAHEAMDELISHYHFFQVQTIDSFINTLLKGCAFRLGLASNFRVKEDYRSYLTYGLDRLIGKISSHKEVRDVFHDFLDYYLFVENKDAWFSKFDIIEMLAALYNCGNAYGGIFKKPAVAPKELIKKKKAIIALIGKLRENAPEGTNKKFITSLDSFLEKNTDGFAMKDISNFFGGDRFPVNKGVSISQKIARQWNNARKSLKELCLLESFAVFSPYLEIFGLTLDEFKKLADVDDVIFLSELNKHARGITGARRMSVPEIYYRIATRFRHYLIDEFQDTSRLQWKNILPLVEEALSSGGSLFYVGDKKQAIFRFRGGEVSLFDSVQDDFKGYTPKQTVLSKNWRSQKEIVEFNNEIFSETNLRRFIEAVDGSREKAAPFAPADTQKILGVFSDSRQERKDGNEYGYVRVEPFDAPSVDERDAFMRPKLISLIGELKKRFLPGDIAVLARENKDIQLFTSWLIEEGVPVESEKTLNIREHALIKEIMSFLAFLNSPIDDLSFASFILGDIFQAASNLGRETVHDFLFKLGARRRRGKKGAYLYREFRNEFGRVWDELIDEFYRSVGFTPPYELAISIFGRFKVVENFPESQAFFMRLLELIKEKEDDYSGLSEFMGYFEKVEEKELFVNIAPTDAAKVLTIHKAKGLEFPVVIVPYLEIDVTVGGSLAGPRRSFVVRQEDGELRLLQLKNKYGLFSRELAQEHKDEYVKSLIDELNSLYVALTRPRHELYAFIPSKSSNKKNLARALMPSEGIYERGSLKKYAKKAEKEEQPAITLPVSRYSDWISVLKDEFKNHLELANRENMVRGSVIHFILSCVGNLETEDKGKSLAAAREKAKYAYPYEKKLDEYLNIARSIVEDKKFRPFFYVKEGEVFCEKEVAASSGARKVLDRLIVRPKEAWVVDYKSSKDETGDQVKQAAEYIDIVKALYPERKVAGFLIYLDKLEMEEVSGESGNVRSKR